MSKTRYISKFRQGAVTRFRLVIVDGKRKTGYLITEKEAENFERLGLEIVQAQNLSEFKPKAKDEAPLFGTCQVACSPSDYCKGGKCDRNGCYTEIVGINNVGSQNLSNNMLSNFEASNSVI